MFVMPRKLQLTHEERRHLLRIPRRPFWTREMTAEQLDENERESFLAWRRGLAVLQEDEGLLLTPFERNLELWRQLWRVIERR
jgi:large subunit GTPase 1